MKVHDENTSFLLVIQARAFKIDDENFRSFCYNFGLFRYHDCMLTSGEHWFNWPLASFTVTAKLLSLISQQKPVACHFDALNCPSYVD